MTLQRGLDEEGERFEQANDEGNASVHASLPADSASHRSEAPNLDGQFESSQPENEGWFAESETTDCIESPSAPTTAMDGDSNGYTDGVHTRGTSSRSGEVTGGGTPLQPSRTAKVSARSRASKKKVKDYKSKSEEAKVANDDARACEAKW